MATSLPLHELVDHFEELAIEGSNAAAAIDIELPTPNEDGQFEKFQLNDLANHGVIVDDDNDSLPENIPMMDEESDGRKVDAESATHAVA